MQKIDANLGSAVYYCANFKNIWNRIDLKTITKKLNLPQFSMKKTRGRPRKLVSILEEIFKRQFFDYLIDVSLKSIAERFESFKAHSEKFSFLYDFKDFQVKLTMEFFGIHAWVLKKR